MYELLDNIYWLVKNRFKHKTKRVIWRDEDTEKKVDEIVDELADKIYDFVFEEVSSAEYSIDSLIEKMEDEWENNPLSRKDSNVFMLKKKKGEWND